MNKIDAWIKRGGRKKEPRISASTKEVLIALVFSIVVAFATWVAVHGIWCDYVNDKLHSRGSCYWCDFYRYIHLDDAAFQTRELRREGNKR